MFKTYLSALAVVAAAALAPAEASAASSAYTIGNVNLRTGPGTRYYQITVIPTGSPVQVYGCLQGYSWCDVGYYNERGWVSSRYLSVFYDDRQIYVPYRPRVTVPFLTFNYGYWDNYYVGRPWYSYRPRPEEPYYRPPVYRPPVYNPPVYRPPVYRPPTYRPPITANPPPCNRDPDCPYRPGWNGNDRPSHGGNDRPHFGNNTRPGWNPGNSSGNWAQPEVVRPRPERPRPEQVFRPGNDHGGNSGGFERPIRPRPGGGDAGVSNGGSGNGKPGKPCVWIDGQCNVGR